VGVLCLAAAAPGWGAPGEKVGVDEKLGTTIPMDLVFNDENGKPVPLKALITKPTLLTLVYYECPGICNPLMTGLAETLDRTELVPGKDYEVLSISFNPDEGAKLAAAKKENYLKMFNRPFPKDGWRFLSGDAKAIDALTEAVGFRYQKVGKDYNHPGVITVLTPEGKIARYLHGINFLPFDIKMSTIEASKGKTMPALSRMLAFCYSYDPEGKKYVFNILKVVGVSMFTFIGLFVAWLVITTRRAKKGQAITP
jgi:protein SCO1/2